MDRLGDNDPLLFKLGDLFGDGVPNGVPGEVAPCSLFTANWEFDDSSSAPGMGGSASVLTGAWGKRFELGDSLGDGETVVCA